MSFGLPVAVRACLFDLDGVLTQTAAVHAKAWKQMFDAYLKERAASTDGASEPFVPFDIDNDYPQYVDGKQRDDGTRDFLASRHITPDEQTIHELGRRKNEIVLRLIHDDGVQVFDGSVAYLRAVRAAGLRTAVVSSSANTTEVLRVTKIHDLFDAQIDGLVAQRDHLPGKPAPDTFLAGAKALGVAPHEAAVFEDALAGVQAGRAGRFAIVIGVDRVHHRQALLEHGADVVVDDLSELLATEQREGAR